MSLFSILCSIWHCWPHPSWMFFGFPYFSDHYLSGFSWGSSSFSHLLKVDILPNWDLSSLFSSVYTHSLGFSPNPIAMTSTYTNPDDRHADLCLHFKTCFWIQTCLSGCLQYLHLDVLREAYRGFSSDSLRTVPQTHIVFIVFVPKKRSPEIGLIFLIMIKNNQIAVPCQAFYLYFFLIHIMIH